MDSNTARMILLSIEIPEETLAAAEKVNKNIDWSPLVWSLDPIFTATGGSMGQMAFMHNQHPELNGMTPIEVLSCPDGIQLVQKAIQGFLRRDYEGKYGQR